nr:uncharacterized protein LOC112709606 [Arachis hypogaea]
MVGSAIERRKWFRANLELEIKVFHDLQTVLSSRRFLAGSLNRISAIRSSDSVLIVVVVSSGLLSAIAGETYEISSDELNELLGENVQKSAAEGLTPDDSNVMVVREQTPSEALAIVPIQFFVPPSQQTTTDADSEPTPMLQIEGARETTPETPKQHQETTPKLPPAPTKIHPDAEEAAALLMMARTASYVPKTDLPMPSFSLGLTDSSQEGASTQETEREKSPEAATMLEQLDSLVQKLASSASKGKDESPQIRRETGGESSAKFETSGGTNQIPDDMKEKCYIWGTRLKEDAKGDTNEFEEICTLTGQGQYILMRTHLASLQANSDIECQSMALSDHPRGEFISPKMNREFRGYVFSRLIAYAGGKPLEKGEKEKEIKAPYVKISGQKTRRRWTTTEWNMLPGYYSVS